MIKIKRPLLIILIGAIIGIIYGLYLKTSIAVTIVLLLLMLFLIQKNKSKAFYFLAKRRKLILIFLISIIISSLYINLANNKFEKTYKQIPKNVTTIATVVSEAKETEYYYSYEIKIQNKKFIMYVKKNEPQLEYGMKIKLQAEFSEPQETRNYKGFSYKNYLKTKKIYGIFKASKIDILKENDVNIILQCSNKVRNKIIQTAKEILPEETEGLMIGILIGENEGIADEIKQNFSKSSLSHIVAISGSHITYIVMGLSFILSKSKIPKRGIYILTIIALIIFMFITRFSPSVVRACIMGIIMLFSRVVHRKLDILNSIALSLIIILIDNPFAINDIGLQLSYLGTLGIVFLNKPISNFLEKHMNKKIAETLAITMSAQIAIMPIMMINFNTISTVFIISNLVAVPLSGAITIYGYANIFVGMLFLELGKVLGYILNILTKILIWIAEITAQIPFAIITVTTVSTIFVIAYYFIIFLIFKKGSMLIQIFLNRRETLVKYAKYIVIIIILIIILINLIPQNLVIYFIDVGQRR